MRLLIVRHAIAVAAGMPGIPDAERPLTPAGAKKFRDAAKGLAAILDPSDVLLASPLLRARQTAEIAAAAWGRVTPRRTPALAGGSFEEVAEVVDRFRARDLVAVVGHEPSLSALLARLLGTSHEARLAFKKGGAALLEVSDGLAGGGQLVWYLPPRLLRALGE